MDNAICENESQSQFISNVTIGEQHSWQHRCRPVSLNANIFEVPSCKSNTRTYFRLIFVYNHHFKIQFFFKLFLFQIVMPGTQNIPHPIHHEWFKAFSSDIAGVIIAHGPLDILKTKTAVGTNSINKSGAQLLGCREVGHPKVYKCRASINNWSDKKCRKTQGLRGPWKTNF